MAHVSLYRSIVRFRNEQIWETASESVRVRKREKKKKEKKESQRTQICRVNVEL